MTKGSQQPKITITAFWKQLQISATTSGQCVYPSRETFSCAWGGPQVWGQFRPLLEMCPVWTVHHVPACRVSTLLWVFVVVHCAGGRVTFVLVWLTWVPVSCACDKSRRFPPRRVDARLCAWGGWSHASDPKLSSLKKTTTENTK